MNQAPHLVLERCPLRLQKLGLWRHRHYTTIMRGGMHDGVRRAHRAENTNLSAPATTPTGTFPSPDQMDRSSRHVGRGLPTTTKSRQNCGICPGSSLHADASGSRKRPWKTWRRCSASLPGWLRVTGASYLPSAHTNPIVFLSNNRKTGLGLGGDQIWTQSSFLISLLAH